MTHPHEKPGPVLFGLTCAAMFGASSLVMAGVTLALFSFCGASLSETQRGAVAVLSLMLGGFIAFGWTVARWEP